jgi:hypothetical protein
VTFLAHSAFGAGVTGLVTKIAFGDPTPGVIVGGILGGLPDTLDWVLWKLGKIERWSVYSVMHHPPLWLLILSIIFCPIGIHIYLDTFIHKEPGYNWWPDYAWLEISLWIVGGTLITLNYL